MYTYIYICMYCKSCRWTLDLPPINPKCDTIKSKNNHTHRPLQKLLVFLYPIFAHYIPQDALFQNDHRFSFFSFFLTQWTILCHDLYVVHRRI